MRDSRIVGRRGTPQATERAGTGMDTTTLSTVELGGTGLQITRIGFGAWAIGGGDWTFGWGPQEDEDSIEAISHALELGINWIDTAAVYGFGHSEEVVGRAIAGMSKRPLILTKCTRVQGPDGRPVGNLHRDSILREAEASLARLGVEAIDLYQVHWPNPEADLEEAWAAMAELKEQGLVRHIGVSNFNVEQMRRCQAIAPVETLQPKYSLIARAIEDEILPYTLRAGIGVIAYSPMGSGMLTGRMTRERIETLPENDWRKSAFSGPDRDELLAVAARVSAVAARVGASPGAVAIAWTLRNPAVDAAIVGLRRADQADELLAGAALELTDADVAELEGV
jgi:aryl-alcohol dehydrogenase-like predicted oxidoreductase